MFWKVIALLILIAELIRIIQNSIQLWYNHKREERLLQGLDEITQEDIGTQREAYQLIVRRLKEEGC